MRYKILLEAECAGLEDVSAVLEELSRRLSGLGISLIDIQKQYARGSVMRAVAADAPSEADVVHYFKELPLPCGINAFDEAMKFYNYNKALGWKRAFEWQALARAWVAHIQADGKAQSFDVDEFFSAALKASEKEVIKEIT